MVTDPITRPLPMTHEELCVLAHAIISTYRAGADPDFLPAATLSLVKEVKNRSEDGGRPIAGLKECKNAVDEVIAEFAKFDEQYNSSVVKYSEALTISASEVMYLLDDEEYYLALMYKRLSLGDSGLLPQEHKWIAEFRETDEYRRIAVELASEAGD